jgi:hypothetical protein
VNLKKLSSSYFFHHSKQLCLLVLTQLNSSRTPAPLAPSAKAFSPLMSRQEPSARDSLALVPKTPKRIAASIVSFFSRRKVRTLSQCSNLDSNDKSCKRASPTFLLYLLYRYRTIRFRRHPIRGDPLPEG